MTVGRKTSKAPVSKEAVIDVGAVQKDFQTSTELALANAQHESAVRAMAERVGYQLDVVDPDLIQRDIAANMRRSVEACLEVGRGLAVLKTACGHGNFIARLDVLGIDRKVAARFMQTADKFSNVSAPRLLKVAGSPSKLFELLVLDDEQIEEFELTGESGELDLDDVARMSHKELRAALREAKAEKEATDHLVDAKNKTIDRLQRQVKVIEKLPPSDVQALVQKEAADIQAETQGMLRGHLRQALIALQGCPEDQTIFMAGMVGQIKADLNMLRDEFNLPEVGDKPEWERWAEAQEIAKTGKQAKAN